MGRFVKYIIQKKKAVFTKIPDDSPVSCLAVVGNVPNAARSGRPRGVCAPERSEWGVSTRSFGFPLHFAVFAPPSAASEVVSKMGRAGWGAQLRGEKRS